jgi:hypothetical protein
MTDTGTILAALQAGADELVREVARLPAAGTLWKPSEDSWSQHECLTHIWIADHFVFLPRLTAIATQENPLLKVVDEVALQKEKWDASRSRDDLLSAFLADRKAEITLLAGADWTRIGTHEQLGPVDAAWIAHYAMGHTWEHTSQMLRARLQYQLRGPR